VVAVPTVVIVAGGVHAGVQATETDIIFINSQQWFTEQNISALDSAYLKG
jgi:hypothetical protein